MRGGMTPLWARVRDFLRAHGWASLAAVLCVLHAVWPGEIQFVNDEPLLIGAALDANAQGTLAVHGLLGTHGAAYGPLPTWLYQAYLAVSHDLVTLVAVRAVLSAALIALALGWLSRTLALWPAFIVIPLCSPWLWFYGRVLWDNTFNLQLCALAIAAWVAFVKTPTRVSLVVTLSCLAAALLVHLMALALVVPLAAHALVFRWRELWRFKGTVLACVVAWGALAAPYLLYLRGNGGGGNGLNLASAEAWLFALQGPRTLSGERLADQFGAQWLAVEPMIGLAARIARVGFVISWLGMLRALWLVVTALRRRQSTVKAHLAGVALGVLAAQSALNGLTGKFDFTHYLNATWIASAVCAWLLFDAVQRWRWARLGLLLTWVLPLLVMTALIARHGHRDGLSREGQGATLANQLAIAAELKRHPPASQVRVAVSNFQRFPHGLQTLLRVVEPAGPPLPATSLLLTYETSAPLDGRVVLQATGAR